MNSKLYCINPNTKEYEEVTTIYGIKIEEILDLIRDYKMSKDLKFDKFGKLEEIERLNNIINEIEKYAGLGEVNWEDKYQDIMLSSKGLLKRIKELKGSCKE